MLSLVNYSVTRCKKQLSPDLAVPCDANMPNISIASAESRTGRKRANRGNSVIEFTLIMPMLLLLMTGMVSAGFALQNYLNLTNAVNLGAQAVAFSRGQTSDPCATGYTAISNAAPTLTASGSGLSLTFTINGTAFAGVTSCPAGASDMVQGSTVQIKGSFPVTLAIYSLNFAPTTIVAKTSEYIQ